MSSDWFGAALYFGVAATGPDREWLAATEGVVYTSLVGLAALLVAVAIADAASRLVSAVEGIRMPLAALPP